MLKRTAVLALSLLASQASAQETYLFGGLGLVQGDYEYTYDPAAETTAFDFDGVAAFFGYGRVVSTSGQVAFAGEIDVAFGDMESDLIEGATTPCLVGEGGCTGTVNALATLRLVASASTGALRPFATLGLAIGDVEGTADLGACGFTPVCAYNESLLGYTAGLGVTYEMNDTWSLRGEVMHVNLGKPEFSSPLDVLSDDIKLTQIRLGAQFRY